jgi:hypothetical protein
MHLCALSRSLGGSFASCAPCEYCCAVQNHVISSVLRFTIIETRQRKAPLRGGSQQRVWPHFFAKINVIIPILGVLRGNPTSDRWIDLPDEGTPTPTQRCRWAVYHPFRSTQRDRRCLAPQRASRSSREPRKTPADCRARRCRPPVNLVAPRRTKSTDGVTICDAVTGEHAWQAWTMSLASVTKVRT